MIGWLQGQRVENWQQGMRKGILLACGGVGYEVQLLSRHLVQTDTVETFTLWINQVQREDGYTLFGFSERTERDLFRTLISVNGVGPQIAMALLEENPVSALVGAIVERDYEQLSKAHGVGKRTAERLVLELSNKLSEFETYKNELSSSNERESQPRQLEQSRRCELQNTLIGLGYEDTEISRAIDAVASEKHLKSSQNISDSPLSKQESDALLRASLIWLSQEAA